ncbi:MAG: arsenate reductase ArsC [Armatimonadetes bacterium]|nr:arsenate reductase ArsC [Armatimonadota bacterium]MCX7967397.1 arsenate reductase ArsC [Armatimonadota bacterium]MDW8142630.1 arsenate reductase ArsC [Armatimonadota bacterium]
MPKRILFVCTGNSARSQMAEGFARAMGIEAFSAGTHPKDEVHPLAIAVMAEKSIDISHHKPKPLDLDFARTVDLIVTVCGEADAECAQLPLPVPKVHWNLPDPAKAEGDETERLQAFRKVRDEIEKLVAKLVAQL